jgi:hypothetical protein
LSRVKLQPEDFAVEAFGSRQIGDAQAGFEDAVQTHPGIIAFAALATNRAAVASSRAKLWAEGLEIG